RGISTRVIELPHQLSFPTRRSSDLPDAVKARRSGSPDCLWRGDGADAVCCRSPQGGGQLVLDRGGQGGGAAEDDRGQRAGRREVDRKSTRLNSSQVSISYAVVCLQR